VRVYQKLFWGEVVTTAASLINKCLSSALGFKTPMELWSGKPADYSNLRVFGALAFAHIKQDKLRTRVVRCVFIGYLSRIKVYKLWRMEPSVSLVEM